MPKYDAVIFDLFGTLVDNVTDAVYHAVLRRSAAALGVDGGAFSAFWVDADFRHQRRCGILPSTAAQMEYVCAHFGIPVVPEAIAHAVDIQHQDFGMTSLIPRTGTIDALRTLRSRGYRLGLISDCSWEVPDIWPQTDFAPIFSATIFSCEAGCRKPDARLYQLACERLGVVPQRCLYVGDGDGRELTGARRAGMDAVLICVPQEREIVMKREDPRQWDGPVIERIEGMLEYLSLEE